MHDAKPREWAPRLWEGMDFFAWLRLLAEGRGRVGFPYWYIAAIISGVSFGNTLCRWFQTSRYRREIERIRLDPPPLFVLGHWRTGTTLMHELFMLDERHTGPTTFHCFEPCHSILSETLFRKHLAFLLPDKRPMDNMRFGWDKPQEEEFALALLGQPSTYTDIAWPNRPSRGTGPLDLSGLTPRQLAAWKRALLQILKTVAFLDRREHGVQRRLVLKSPPHTARVPVLLEMFPDAQFVYLRRDPHVLLPSTINLWQSFARKHGLQTPRRSDLLQDKVLREFRTIVERYDAARPLIPPGRLVEIRFEDLVGDIPGVMQRVYGELNLGGWERVRPAIEANAAARRDYQPNRYVISEDVRQLVEQHWGDIVRRWGYCPAEATTSISS